MHISIRTSDVYTWASPAAFPNTLVPRMKRKHSPSQTLQARWASREKDSGTYGHSEGEQP